MLKSISIFKSLNVLYAEDDLIIQESVTRILKLFFKEVFVANDGSKALEIYNNNRIDVVILDYVMPNFDGYQAAKLIRDINKKISDEQLKVIIEKDNIKLLTTIGSNIDDFKSCNRCKHIKYFAKHPSSKVRYSLFNYNISDLITTETLVELSKDEDFDVSREAKKELKNRRS